ncbi:PLP-dependent transferase [Aspergillus lucknowensis]|uniref:PLP-dependent transferase n=1 Tax=Aspergillus lucknowensis TaxID=176173 RepID=A0ABR4LGH3_9EURO
MALTPLFPLTAFDAPPEAITHVCAGGLALPLKSQHAALTRHMAHKTAGHKGHAEQDRELDAVRNLAARSWGVPVDDIGFVSSVAEGVSILLESRQWEKGDNVFVGKDDFSSVIAPFAVRAQRLGRSVTPTVIYSSSSDDEEAELEKKVNSKTRVIAVSYVSYLNGARVDLTAYRRAADRVGAILLVDFTQAAGYLPIDASVADFAFSSCFKFLLGTTGTAIAFWNRARQPDWKPATAGCFSLTLRQALLNWEREEPVETRDSALCFSRGNPGHVSIYILREALEFLSQWEAAEIEEHVLTLTTELLRRLDEEGIRCSTPREKSRHGANVTIDCVGASEIVNSLYTAGVYAWNGTGRVRFSFHGYNCMKDVDRIMEVFPGLWREWNA